MFLDKLETPGLQVVRRQDRRLASATASPASSARTAAARPTSPTRSAGCMGEQSAKQLRGDSMDDVIFNGSPDAQADRHGRGPPHLQERPRHPARPSTPRSTISRRVFRSGMSEYFLNKTPCRLKDIRDLFFDTGMGSHAYSVIERSMVDHVLSRQLRATAASCSRRRRASPSTRRARRRRSTSSRPPRATSRALNDIVFEIERELRSLARQVGKARRYQRLRDEIQDLDLTLTAGRVARADARARRRRPSSWQDEAVRREGVAARARRARGAAQRPEARAARAGARAVDRAGRARATARRRASGRAPGRAARASARPG